MSRRWRRVAVPLALLLAALAWLQWAPLPASLQRVDYATLMLDRHGRPLASS